MVVFVLFRLVSSIFPPILGVSTLLHPYSHLSCDHICTSPAGTIHLPVHFHRFFHFSIRISVFQLVLFVILQPASWPRGVPRGPTGYIHPFFYPFMYFSTHICTHSCRLFTSPSISPSFMWSYLYFSSRRHPSNRPLSPSLHFPILISVFQMPVFCTSRGVLPKSLATPH